MRKTSISRSPSTTVQSAPRFTTILEVRLFSTCSHITRLLIQSEFFERFSRKAVSTAPNTWPPAGHRYLSDCLHTVLWRSDYVFCCLVRLRCYRWADCRPNLQA